MDDRPSPPKSAPATSTPRADADEAPVTWLDFAKAARDAGFLHKLVLLLIGFALTSLLGTYLANQFRRETAKTEFEVAAMQADISRSIAVFETLSQLMDKRLFRMSRLHDVFNGDIGPEALQERLADYRAVFIEWNDNANRYRALFAFYFSRASVTAAADPPTMPCAESFETIATHFNKTHVELQKLINKTPDGSSAKLKQMLDELNACTYALDEWMLFRMSALRAAYREKIASY